MREIVTVQFGHRANHVGTHFWNAQEAYFTYDASATPSPVDHDVHWRPGVNDKGEETFTPRALIYDLKGGFGGLKKWGGLYDQELSVDEQFQGAKDGVTWAGKVALQQDPQIPQVEYQRSLEEGAPTPASLTTETVRYWSDYNRVFYHPRSIVPLNEYELNSSLMPFENYESGQELFANLNGEEDILDRDLRLWVEECDHLQGLQIFSGSDDAWAGLASSYLQSLRDEFGKLSIWTWGMSADQARGSRAEQMGKALNSCRFITDLATLASLYIPTSIPTKPLPSSVNLDRESQWHTSALISAAIETVTLPSRLRRSERSAGSMDEAEAILDANGNQRLAQLQCTLADADEPVHPSLLAEESDNRLRREMDADSDHKATLQSDLSVDISGFAEIKRNTLRAQARERVFGMVVCSRGSNLGTITPTAERSSVDELMKMRFTREPIISRYHSGLGYPIPDSFPHIIESGFPGEIDISASIRTSTNCVEGLLGLKSSITLAPQSERETLKNSLEELAEAYVEGYDDDSIYDSDD